MGRLYLPLDVDFEDDEKVARLTRYTKPCEARAARDLLVAMWRYCKRERSDGNVPAEIVGKLVYPDSPKIGARDADRLVAVGLAERTPDGYFLPGYLKRNKSRAQLEAEAEKKAEAGRKGGLASGVLRKAEVASKHGASPVLQPSEAKDRDRDTDRDNVQSSESGDRPVTLRPVDATAPPPRIPSDARCTAHVGVADPGPCRGCRAAREKAEREAAQAEERASRERAERIRNCPDCHGSGIREDDQGKPIGKCAHRRAS